MTRRFDHSYSLAMSGFANPSDAECIRIDERESYLGSLAEAGDALETSLTRKPNSRIQVALEIIDSEIERVRSLDTPKYIQRIGRGVRPITQQHETNEL